MDHHTADKRGAPTENLPLSDQELQILAAWDRLQELRLEIAILNAQNRAVQDGSTEDITGDDANEAKTALVEARAKYMLRNQVIDLVMSVNPILKAVHNGVRASPIERDLLPYVQRRDEESIAVAKHAVKQGGVREKLGQVQSEIIDASLRNVKLTSELLSLVDELKKVEPSTSSDPEVQNAMEEAQRDLAASRRRWMVVKGLASGVVVGSGVNWAADDELENVVLDPEDE